MAITREVTARASKQIFLTRAQVWAMNRRLHVVQETPDALEVQCVLAEAEKPCEGGAEGVLWSVQTRIMDAQGNAVTVLVTAVPTGPIAAEQAAVEVPPEVLVEELCEFLAGKPASRTPPPPRPPGP